MMKFLSHVANIYRISAANDHKVIDVAYNMFTNNIHDSVKVTDGGDQYFYEGAVGINYPDLYPDLTELIGETNAFNSWTRKHYAKLSAMSRAGDYDGIAAFALANPTIPYDPIIYPEGVRDPEV